MPIDLDVESLLRAAGMKYSKEVAPDKGVEYSLPFDTPNGPVQVSVAVDEAFVAWAFLRCLDDLSIGSRVYYYRYLLNVNSFNGFARAFVWEVSKKSEWFGVTCQIPLQGITPDSAAQAIFDLVGLANSALDTLDKATKNSVSQHLTQ